MIGLRHLKAVKHLFRTRTCVADGCGCQQKNHLDHLCGVCRLEIHGAYPSETKRKNPGDLTVSLSDDRLDALDAFMVKHSIETREEAAAWLLGVGLISASLFDQMDMLRVPTISTVEAAPRS